ncbi:MAG: glycosyltransferase [Pseudolysinimonas sp.]
MTVYGFLSTYPPTRCGLASFTDSLASAIPRASDADARIVRVDDLVPTGPPVLGARTIVVDDLRPASLNSRIAAAAALSSCDVAIIQHEFGIYGGRDGDEILDVLDRITAPCVVVLHTVLERPSAHQRWLVERIAGLASAVVVMTRTAHDLLERHSRIAMSKVHVIPHGVPDWSHAHVADPTRRPTVLTWGLLGPGKGIEWGIQAFALLSTMKPAPLYRIVGQTHPKVLADSGDAYRQSLVRLARELGISDNVEFDDGYQSAEQLAAIVASSDVVLLPYDTRDQTTSGVLVEAIAAGKPVVATRFPHSIELLGNGAGILVDHESPQQIATALHRVLGRREVAADLAEAALAGAPSAIWSEVASGYRALVASLEQVRAA